MKIMTYRRAELEAAIVGYEKTGVPLVGWANGEPLVGLENDPLIRWEYGDLFPVDEFGSSIAGNYFIPLLYRLSGFDLDKVISIYYYSIMGLSTVIAVICLALLYKNSLQRLVVCIFLVGIVLVAYRILTDVYVVNFAVSILVAPIALLLYQTENLRLPHFLIVIGVGAVISLGHYMRIGSSLPAFLFMATLFLTKTTTSKLTKYYLIACVAVGLSIPAAFFQTLVAQRDAYALSYSHEFYRTDLRPEHYRIRCGGCWHSFYIGLGFLKNDFVEKYDDKIGRAKVLSINPNATSHSEYNDILRKEVFRLIVTEKYFVFRTIFAKIGVLLGYLLLFSNVGLIFAILYRKSLKLEIAFWLAITSGGSIGVLVIPSPHYVFSMLVFSAIYSISSINYALNMGVSGRFVRALRWGGRSS